MSRLSKKTKSEWSFFWNDEIGRRAYNELCRKCRNECKQSFRARFTDRYGDVFVYCTLKDICETFSCVHDKATKMLKELERYGLISRQQQGKGRPARIYVHKFITEP